MGLSVSDAGRPQLEKSHEEQLPPYASPARGARGGAKAPHPHTHTS